MTDFDPELAQLKGASLERDYADFQRRLREDAAEWDPLDLMSRPRNFSGPAGEAVSGRYAARLRLFWGSIALSLAVWGHGRPSTAVEDDDARNALEHVAMALCARPNLTWPHALLRLHEALTNRKDKPSPFAAELPQAERAFGEVILTAPERPPSVPWPLRFDWGYLRSEAKVLLTHHSRDERLRLFWASVWLALAAWGAAPSDWVEQPVRMRARVAIEHAADAVCARTGAGLKATEDEVRAVIGDARVARSTREQP